MKKLLLASALFLTGCASLPERSLFLEMEHVSHPTSGWPFGPANEEIAVTQANALLSMHNDAGWYVEGGLGYNVEGEFKGSPLTFTGRVGKEFKLR